MALLVCFPAARVAVHSIDIASAWGKELQMGNSVVTRTYNSEIVFFTETPKFIA